MDDFARAARFATRLENGLAAQLRPWVGGTAVLDPGNPDTWDLNFLRLERAWGVEPAALPPAVEQTARHMGMRTPIVVVPPTADETQRLAPALAAAGYVREGFVYMALRGTPADPAPTADVRELRFEEARPHRRVHLSVPWRSGEENRYPTLVDQLVEKEARASALVDDRWFAVADGGALVAMCRLLARDDVGQVEDVSTLPDHRGRGYARAVVGTAVAASRAAGHSLTFITAHEDDWPRQFYARLGFEHVGTVRRFRRS
jgi:GNAT superfamily N-acetyltransferase